MTDAPGHDASSRGNAPGMAADGSAGGGRLAVVTGAAGFIGRHLVQELLDRGWRVRAVDLHGSLEASASARSETVRADVRDEAAMEAALAGADTVFHLASAHLQVHAPADWYESVNVRAMASLVALCARAGVRRLVHTSSVGIYGHVQNPPAREDSPKNPESEYERTKLAGETVALQEARRVGLDLVVLRPGWVYGPGCPRTAKLLRSIRRGRFVYIGAGRNLRHPIHVDDMVEAFALAADAPGSVARRAYLVVGPRAVTVRELVETCARVQDVRPPAVHVPRPVGVLLGVALESSFGLLRRDPPFSRRSLAFFDNDNAFDGSAAAGELGFVPRVDLVEGLSRSVEAEPRPARGVR